MEILVFKTNASGSIHILGQIKEVKCVDHADECTFQLEKERERERINARCRLQTKQYKRKVDQQTLLIELLPFPSQ